MKRLLCTLFILLMLAGCTPATERPTSTPGLTEPVQTQTPALSPAPEPVRVLFVADCDTQDAADFFFGAAKSAHAEGWQISTFAGDGFKDAVLLEKYDGILALITQQNTSVDDLSAVASQGTHIAIADLRGHEPVDGVSYAYYDTTMAASAALDAAISYPPHDTPVRLIALLEKKGSPADEAFREGVQLGRVFSKASHYGTNAQDVRNFMDEQLEAYVEGTIDAVYAENEHLAQTALDALSDLDRTDMEVFCVPANALSAQRGMYQRWTFPVVMGADLVIVGEGRARALAELMNGGAPNISSFLPVKQIPGETKPDEKVPAP